MKLHQVTPPDAIKQDVIEEQRVTSDVEDAVALLGIDPNSHEYAQTVAELKLLKRSNPRLYRKAINLD